MSKEKKKKNNKAVSAILTILIIICLGMVVFSAYKLISLKMAYRVGEKEYDSLLAYTETQITQGETDAKSEEEARPEDPAVVTQKKQAPIKVDFEALKEINPDIVGWIYIGALDISYPIVQGEDNEYYLHRTFEKTDNFAGSIFMEASNKNDFSDMNTIIYGHNMKNLSMFGKLKKLQTEELYKNDDTFWILTPEENYCYRMFNAAVVSTSDRVYTLFEGAGENWVEYLAYCFGRSEIPFDQKEFTEETRIITLSTCTNSGASRFVVQGLLEE